MIFYLLLWQNHEKDFSCGISVCDKLGLTNLKLGTQIQDF